MKMVHVAEIELYNILKTRFSETEAEGIVASLDQKVTAKFEDRKNEFPTKEDLYKVKEELKIDNFKLKDELKTDISKLKDEMSKLEIRVAQGLATQINWMFIFWIGQLAAFVAIAKFLFHQ